MIRVRRRKPARWNTRDKVCVLVTGLIVFSLMLAVTATSKQNDNVHAKNRQLISKVTNLQNDNNGLRDTIAEKKSVSNLSRVANSYGLTQDESRIR